MQRYVDPTNDFAFKRVFADKARLINLINALMQLPEGHQIVNLTYIPQEEVPGREHRKSGLIDLKCQDERGNFFIVEMQNGYEPHLLKRMQFYAANTYVGQLEKGLKHSHLFPVFVIIILGHQVISPRIPMISCHQMLETASGEHLFKDISYIVVELKKFTKTEEELSSYADYWLYFLSRWDVAKTPPKTLKDPLILTAYEQIERHNLSEAEYQAYIEARIITEREEDQLETRYNEGIEKGTINVAQNLLKQGLSSAMIAQATGLSLEQIKKLEELQ